MLEKKLTGRYQVGQAYAEIVVGFSVVALFLLGSYHVWRYAEFQQTAVDAVRFAAWERVVWEPSDNSVEKFAIHKTDEQLAKDTVMRQLSTPAAWRNFRSGLEGNGSPAQTTFADRRDTLGAALKSFVSSDTDPNNMISLSTSSGWTNSAEAWYRGRDPTFNTTTSLELDRETYRTVKLSLKSQFTPTTSLRFFDFFLPPVVADKHLSLITNAWAASTPMMFVRTERQLLPFSTGDDISGTKPNNMAFFGLNPSSGTNAADFVGMVPFWNFVGGPYGLAGQYNVNQVGASGDFANTLIETRGQSFLSFDISNPGTSLGLMPEVDQQEFFKPNAVSNWQHRNTLIISKTKEDDDEKAGTKSRNSNIGKRKYRAQSLQNPVETYFVH